MRVDTASPLTSAATETRTAETSVTRRVVRLDTPTVATVPSTSLSATTAYVSRRTTSATASTTAETDLTRNLRSAVSSCPVSQFDNWYFTSSSTIMENLTERDIKQVLREKTT